MNRLKHTIRKLRISYFVVCIAAIILYSTGYSFTLDFFDYLLIAIVIIYPIIELVRSSIRGWIKILTVLVVVVLISFVVGKLIFFSAFGEKIKRTSIRWNIDGYKITLCEKQGWAGGPYKQFDLVRYRLYGLINKTVAYSFSEQEPVYPCEIQFSENGYRSKPLYIFDSCAKTFKTVKQP